MTPPCSSGPNRIFLDRGEGRAARQVTVAGRSLHRVYITHIRKQ